MTRHSVNNSYRRHVGYLLHRRNVVNLRMLTNCCLWNYTPVEKHGQQIKVA